MKRINQYKFKTDNNHLEDGSAKIVLNNNTFPKGSKDNPYTQEEFEAFEEGTWPGGYVESWGYVFQDANINSSGSSESSSSNTTEGSSSSSSTSDPYNPEDYNTPEPSDTQYYTRAKAEKLMDEGKWPGGFVINYGYVLPLVIIFPSSSSSPNNGYEILRRAQAFNGVPYKWGGNDINGIDCSGLVSAAINYKGRWTTDKHLVGFRDIINNMNQSTKNNLKNDPTSLIPFLEIGDILVWHGQHAVIYAGNGDIFHAHGEKGTPTGITHDLKTYWLNKKGMPTVYRK